MPPLTGMDKVGGTPWWRYLSPEANQTFTKPAPPTPVQAPVQTSIATGINPGDVANALYGKVIPISALGLARIGTAGLIWGPYFNEGRASFAVSFGFPANVDGVRRVYEISLDGKVAWEHSSGSPEGALNPTGFLSDPFECRFYGGTMTQGADPLEVAMFGDQAVAYRPQMCLWFNNLNVAPFDDKCPFVSCKIGDVTDGATPEDGINLGTALTRFAYSPWIEFDSSTFETDGVADIVQAMILTEDQTFLDLLQTTARVYRTLDILQTDMLRVKDRGSTVSPDVTLHRDHITDEGSVQFLRAEESSVSRELELMTIDPDADYVFIPSKAARPLTPVPVTSSVSKDSITLPVVIGATTRASLVTFAKYQEDNARKRLSLQAMLYGYSLEPGDLFNLSGIADGLDPGEIFKVVETSHGANYINEISAEAILKCSIAAEGDPYFDSIILLLHANTGSPVTDHSGLNNPMVLEGDAYVDTSVKKFNAGSFRFDGNGDRVGEIEGGEWEAFDTLSPTNTSPYVIELWVRFAEVGVIDRHQILICRNDALIGTRLWTLYNPTVSDELTFLSSNNGISPSVTLTTAGADLVVNTWYHIAVDKDSTGYIRIYVNGIMRAGSTFANSIMCPGLAGINLGSSGGGFQSPFNGWIDDARVTKVSRYGDVYGDAGFTVPGFQFPDHV